MLKIQTELSVINFPFREFRWLKHIKLPDGMTKVRRLWFSPVQIESVEIPASVRRIEANAFRNCKTLNEIIFAEGSKLEVVEAYAFGGTALDPELVCFPSGAQVSPHAFTLK